MKIFIPTELYNEAKAIAKTRNQTVDEWINETCTRMLEEAKAKHP